MRAHFGLPSVRSENREIKLPITVKWEIPYLTLSGSASFHLWAVVHFD